MEQVNTECQYYFEQVSTGVIKLSALRWFGVKMIRTEADKVRDMLKTYPATSLDEAVETVLIIYLTNKKKYKNE